MKAVKVQYIVKIEYGGGRLLFYPYEILWKNITVAFVLNENS